MSSAASAAAAETDSDSARQGPLKDLKVIDAATIFAGPTIATLMGDFGADVIKIDHPRGDDLRKGGWQKEGIAMWSLLLSRNKRCITLNLKKPAGQTLLLELLKDADVFIENFRPGTLERWGIPPERLQEVNPGLVIVRMTGFGQTGPYSDRPGFGTAAEAISGFAYSNGHPDGPPTLPPAALADGIAGLAGTFATMFALWWRDHGGEKGQVVDVSLYEPLFWLMGVHVPVYDQLGEVQERMGNRLAFSAPRNMYRAKDGKWLALSGTSQSVAERIMDIVGRPELAEESWFADQTGRLEHADLLDEVIQDWIGGRSSKAVLDAFADGNAVIAPVLSIADIYADPQYEARENIVTVDHPKLGRVKLPNVMPRLSETPGRIDHAGPELGEQNDEVYEQELGLEPAAVARLRAQGVI